MLKILEILQSLQISIRKNSNVIGRGAVGINSRSQVNFFLKITCGFIFNWPKIDNRLPKNPGSILGWGVLVFDNFPSIHAKSLNSRANSVQMCKTVYWVLHCWDVFAWLNEMSTF